MLWKMPGADEIRNARCLYRKRSLWVLVVVIFGTPHLAPIVGKLGLDPAL